MCNFLAKTLPYCLWVKIAVLAFYTPLTIFGETANEQASWPMPEPRPAGFERQVEITKLTNNRDKNRLSLIVLIPSFFKSFS